MRQIKTIKGAFTQQQLEQILGMPTWAWEQDLAPLEGNKGFNECGLAHGSKQTAGWGNSRACGRIWIHSDGICFAPGMAGIVDDIEFCNEMHRKVSESLQ